MGEIQPYVLVYYNSIKSILQQPLIHTQKIKYISFDVSNLYIILGASSGGLYVFRREPCSFVQIIPSQEGPVVQVSISPDDKYIAFATAKKSLIIIQLNNSNGRLFTKIIFRDKFESPITCMKWNIYSTELFLGDQTGQISVVILTDFLAKTMFQPSCDQLMRLDSEIIQIDWNSSLLLVSTMTRCYICDTDREEYRQAGRKLREGEFGICFLNKNSSDTSIELNRAEKRKEGWFMSKSVSDDTLPAHPYYQNLKIYCSRPGARLWEVQFDGTVMKTLQFKNACSDCPSDVIHYDYDPDLRIQLLSYDNTEPVCVTFSKLHVIKKRFILTYKKDYLYILDPESTTVVAWYRNSDEDIQNVQIIGSFIYLWCASGNIFLIQLAEIEKFLLRTFINKQYYFCIDLCDRYMSYLMNLVSKSNKLYLLNSLKKKIDNSEALKKIEPLLKKIQEATENRQNAQILETGIYMIENAFVSAIKSTTDEAINTNFDKNITTKTVQNTKTESVDVEDNSIVFKPKQSLNKAKNKTEGDLEDIRSVSENQLNEISVIVPPNPVPQINSHLDIAYQYFTLHKISKNYNCAVLDEILKSYASIDEIDNFVESLKTYLYNKNDTSDYLKCDIWCYNLYLRFIDLKLSSSLTNLQIVDELIQTNKHWYLQNAFIELNLSTELACTCGYPIPGVSQFTDIHYFNIGERLIQTLWNSIPKRTECYTICKKVPYMWRVLIELIEQKELLPLLLQFHDRLILEFHMYNFDDKQKRETIHLMATLINEQKCLSCDQLINNTGCIMNWTDFGMVLLKVMGRHETLKYFIENSDLIPSGTLSQEFYSLCILSINSNKHDFQLYLDMANSNPQMLQKTLKQYLGNQFEGRKNEINKN